MRMGDLQKHNKNFIMFVYDEAMFNSLWPRDAILHAIEQGNGFLAECGNKPLHSPIFGSDI